MTYQKLKDTIIEKDNGVMTEKQFRRFIFRFAMMILTLALEFALVAGILVNTYLSIFVMIIMVFAFLWILDWCAEDEKVLKRFNLMSKFCPILNLGLIVGTYWVLHQFMFV